MKVGIDLGTTYSVVARYNSETSRTEIVRNKYLKDLTPSVICFLDDGTAIIGEEAKDLQKDGAGTIAAVFKVSMGTKDTCAEIRNRKFDAEDLSALMLKELVNESEATTGEKIEGAVITVPAYFDDLQRIATKHAAESAGLKVIKIINEPTAAAIYYGYKHSEGKTILTYDLGGGTFDVTIVKVTHGSIEVKGTKGNHNLGGKDWDEALMNIACERFYDQYGDDPRDDVHKRFEILANAEDYKKLLSRNESIAFSIAYNGNTGRYLITRREFEETTSYLISTTTEVLDDLFKSLGMSFADIDEVLLCGGSTRLPQIETHLKSYGFRTIIKHKDTDLAVAKGAAMVASLYSSDERRIKDLDVIDVTAHSLGVLSIDPELGAYVNEIMIPNNSPIPTSVTKSFRIEEGNLTDQIEVYMLQGESPIPSDCSVVRKEIITGFDNIGKSLVLDITYSYNEEGIVSVTASRNGIPVTVISDTVPEDVAWMSGAPRETASNKRVAKNIVFCVDLSRSMKAALPDVQMAIRNYITSFNGDFTKFGLIGFGDKCRALCDLTLDDEEILAKVDKLKINSLGRGTDACPLPAVCSMLSEEKGAKYAIVITDGIWGNRNQAVTDAEECRNKMIYVASVGLGNVEKSFLNQIATIPESAIYTTINNLGKTINTIATTINNSPTGLMEYFK